MNRQQAERILSGYLYIWSNPNMKDAAESLREIILDAMTEYRTSSITVPNITYPGTTYPGTTYHKPIVTCEA